MSRTKNCYQNSKLLRRLTPIIQPIYNVIGRWRYTFTTWHCGLKLVKEQNLTTTNLTYHIHIAMFGNKIIVIVPGNTQGYTNSIIHKYSKTSHKRTSGTILKFGQLSSRNTIKTSGWQTQLVLQKNYLTFSLISKQVPRRKQNTCWKQITVTWLTWITSFVHIINFITITTVLELK